MHRVHGIVRTEIISDVIFKITIKLGEKIVCFLRSIILRVFSLGVNVNICVYNIYSYTFVYR